MIIVTKSNTSTHMYVHTTKTQTQTNVIVMIMNHKNDTSYEIKCEYTHVCTYNTNTHERNSYHNDE